MRLLGFEAYITVNDVALPEYEVKLDEGAITGTCWVPSEAGKSFTIKWRALEPLPFKVSGDVDLDGLDVGGHLLVENDCALCYLEDIVTSPTTTRPFVFAPLQVTDDDTYLESQSMNHLGDIVLTLSHVELGDVEHPEEKDPPIDEKIHERSKKAMVHRINFGEEAVKPEVITVITTEHISTLVIFTFKYRSIDVLMADGIAPPTARGKRKAGEMDDESSEDDNGESGDDEEEVFAAELKALAVSPASSLFTLLFHVPCTLS